MKEIIKSAFVDFINVNAIICLIAFTMVSIKMGSFITLMGDFVFIWFVYEVFVYMMKIILEKMRGVRK